MEKNNKIRLKNSAKDFGIELSDIQLKQFSYYCDNVLYWNKPVGITAYKEEKDIVDYMFLDSLAGYKLKDQLINGTVVDVGTGGGFPAIPLKMVIPDMDISLLDSSQKKCDFLDNVIRILKFQNCRTINRSTTALKDKKFDIAISRAFKNFDDLIKNIFPILKENGVIFAWKGPSWREELKKAEKVMKKYNASVIDSYEYSIPNTDVISRFIVKIEKNI
ncbi:16S rRNA (guanine(527)-N(7))-methyltransferase RsmG [bacterium]|nr:16S rRNA (guanine(527)-N(7))-methyltransferase RsmG [bacterium]